MRMATGVGLHIAADGCTAAIVTNDGEPQYIVREPVLHMSADGDATLGGDAPPGRSHTITGFVEAVGDPAGIPVDDGEAYRAEDLLATALFCLINLTAEHLSGATEFYATHPADWPEPQVRALREALDYLGLRSVVLLGEGELPEATASPLATGTRAEILAKGAAEAALVAVLETPAGAAPPDPTTAENATVDTVVMPAVPKSEPQAQAYSAAMPVADPALTVGSTALIGAGSATENPAAPASAGQEAASAQPTVAAEDTAKTEAAPKSRRAKTHRGRANHAKPDEANKRIPLLIAGAALLGLVLGGVGVALLAGADDPVPAQPGQDNRSEPVSVIPTTTVPVPPAPPPPPPAPAPTEEPAAPVTTTEPEPTTTTPPPTTEEPTTTTEEPTSTSPTTTSPTRTTTTRRYPWPTIPMPPGLEIPGTGYY
ncbi:hypothetical protein B0T44_11955 [Nocardia donostiensis]|uniref:Uncharacterized protein n=2 Tax=Nocardia donostiensis TaxID=1538463 RepID=A0A1W0BC69_9NOCA|nr:hypothetical protein B0T46_06280 [Nocardia donostiensis]OQS19951.1 hypothetical protein B0T44_11955 [Nocardia donostiensis]